jgi:DNA-binding beta-propeller fold protein YncE
MKMSALAAIAAFSLQALAPAAHGAPGASGLKIVQRIPGPDGGWDYASFDPVRRRVYVAHGDKVVMIEADSGKVAVDFAKGDHLHAVVPVPGTDRLVTTNSGDSSAKIINVRTGAVVASIPAAQDTDSAAFDPATGFVIVVGGDSGELTLVDPKAAKAVGSIKVGGALEFLAPDGKGKVFINGEDTNQIVVVDLRARKVLAHWPLTGCRRPTGLALVAGERLVSACGNGVAKILSAADGHDIATLTIGEGPDAVLYDAPRRLALIPSGRSGTLAVIALDGPHANTVVDTVPTQIGARTGALDPKTGRVWLPTAQYNLPVAVGQRPTTKPGTFEVLVLGR